MALDGGGKQLGQDKYICGVQLSTIIESPEAAQLSPALWDPLSAPRNALQGDGGNEETSCEAAHG